MRSSCDHAKLVLTVITAPKPSEEGSAQTRYEENSDIPTEVMGQAFPGIATSRSQSPLGCIHYKILNQFSEELIIEYLFPSALDESDLT